MGIDHQLVRSSIVKKIMRGAAITCTGSSSRRGETQTRQMQWSYMQPCEPLEITCTASSSGAAAAAASMAAPTFAELVRCFLDDIPVVCGNFCGHTFRSDSRTEATRRKNGDELRLHI